MGTKDPLKIYNYCLLLSNKLIKAPEISADEKRHLIIITRLAENGADYIPNRASQDNYLRQKSDDVAHILEKLDVKFLNGLRLLNSEILSYMLINDNKAIDLSSLPKLGPTTLKTTIDTEQGELNEVSMVA